MLINKHNSVQSTSAGPVRLILSRAPAEQRRVAQAVVMFPSVSTGAAGQVHVWSIKLKCVHWQGNGRVFCFQIENSATDQ